MCHAIAPRITHNTKNNLDYINNNSDGLELQGCANMEAVS